MATLTGLNGTGLSAPLATAPDISTANLPVLNGPLATALANLNTANLGLPQNQQVADYTFVLSDNGKHVYHPTSDTTARTFTIPPNSITAFPVGSTIVVVNGHAAGSVTIAIAGGDTMRREGTGTTSSLTLAADGMATLLKIGTTLWIASGGASLT
jgi:hypothetical protein